MLHPEKTSVVVEGRRKGLGTRFGLLCLVAGSLLVLRPMKCYGVSWGCYMFIVVGYALQSLLLESIYYKHGWQIHNIDWKIQPQRREKVPHRMVFGLPFIGPVKPSRHPLHVIFSTINLHVAGLFAFAVCELFMRGHTQMYGNQQAWPALSIIVTELAGAVARQSVLEYYWHLIMHLPRVYRVAHKYHHFYKSPEPFDDLFIHPLEGFGYQCILFSPVAVMPMHVTSFSLYMALLGVCGVLDHSGIDFRVRLPILGTTLYSSRDHDYHHEVFSKNFAFPFPFLDHIHGTYAEREV